MQAVRGGERHTRGLQCSRKPLKEGTSAYNMLILDVVRETNVRVAECATPHLLN